MRALRLLPCLGLVLAGACQSEKKPPTDRDFVANPAAGPEPRLAPAVPAQESGQGRARPASRSAEPPPAPVAATTPPSREDDGAVAGDDTVFFDDDFSRGGACAKGNTRSGFGWAEAQTGRPDSVYAVPDPDSPSGCALAFVFGGNSDLADDAWAEQRFKVGKVQGERAREIFVGFVIKVPPNYVHRDGKGPDNNKLLRLWDESYRPSVVHLGMSALRKPDGRGSQLVVEYMQDRKTGNFNKGPWSIILLPGKVDTVGYYVRTSSSVNAPDGVIRVWWNRQLKLELTGLRLANPIEGNKGYNGFGNGYLLGWANSGFTERTEFRVWRFVIAPQPLPWFLP